MGANEKIEIAKVMTRCYLVLIFNFTNFKVLKWLEKEFWQYTLL